MVIVGKHINGITINPLEYLLDDDGEVMEFDTEKSAKTYLRDRDFTDDDLFDLVFEQVDDPAEEVNPDPPLTEVSKNENPDGQIISESLSKTELTEAYSTINKIEDLISEADGLFSQIPLVIQDAILNAHNESATLQYCLRWGLQAVKEIRSDWHTVVADLPCWEREGV
jgi:hypothetical protein